MTPLTLKYSPWGGGIQGGKRSFQGGHRNPADATTSALLLQRTRQLPVSRQQQQLLNNLTVQNCITGVRFPEESDHLLWSLREKWNGSLLYILRP